jgi:hypothetical protein
VFEARQRTAHNALRKAGHEGLVVRFGYVSGGQSADVRPRRRTTRSHASSFRDVRNFERISLLGCPARTSAASSPVPPPYLFTVIGLLDRTFNMLGGIDVFPR